MAAPAPLTGTHRYFLIKLSFHGPDGWQSRQDADSAGAGCGIQWAEAREIRAPTGGGIRVAEGQPQF
jgi:hypothetical protein